MNENRLQQEWAGVETPTEILSRISARITSARMHLQRDGEVDDEHWADLYERSLTWLNEASSLCDVLREKIKQIQ